MLNGNARVLHTVLRTIRPCTASPDRVKVGAGDALCLSSHPGQAARDGCAVTLAAERSHRLSYTTRVQVAAHTCALLLSTPISWLSDCIDQSPGVTSVHLHHGESR
jgi:hypothetical protein